MIHRCLKFNLRHPYICLAIAVGLSIIGATRAQKIPVKLSLIDLLPPTTESVVDMNIVAQEISGIGYLAVLVGPMDSPEASLPKIKDAISDYYLVRHVFY